MKTLRWLLWLSLSAVIVATVQGQSETDEVKESQLVGVERALDDGNFLGLAIEGNSLMLRFYDEEKQLIAPMAARAAAWWKPVNVGGRERVVLNPSGDGLKSPPKVRPPHVFFVMLTLIDAEGESIGTHRFDMVELRQQNSTGSADPPAASRY